MKIVQKFGGTSVADISKIRSAATRVKSEVEKGNQVIVVVSAMAGVTNQLISYCQEFSSNHNMREYDVVVSAGEQITSGLMSIALQDLNISSVSLLGWQIPIFTNDAHAKALINSIDNAKILKHLDKGEVVVVPGFQGVTKNREIVTLGRGGSDITAVALAVSVDADYCDIYTDVDGVYTSDPRIVKKAKKIDKITYEEMLEMASLGAKVLQTRSVELAMKFDIPLRVLSSFSDGPGTLICSEEEVVEKEVVSGIAHSMDEAKITLVSVEDRPGIAASIFHTLSEYNINVDMIVQNVSEDGSTDLTFTVSKHELLSAKDAVENNKEIKWRKLLIDDDVSKVSVVGVGMKSHAGVAMTMFKALAEKNINIEVISTSEIKVSVLIKANFTQDAIVCLHEAFGLDQVEDSSQ